MTLVVREAISKVFGSIKTTLIEMFDERYVVVIKAFVATPIATTILQGGGSIQYRDFSNTNPLEFDRLKDPIIVMRWISDVEGFFFTCSCTESQIVKFVLNLLRLGTKDWWKLVTSACSPAEKVVVTWE